MKTENKGGKSDLGSEDERGEGHIKKSEKMMNAERKGNGKGRSGRRGKRSAGVEEREEDGRK